MPLSPLDRAFLEDIAETNWLHHFVAASSFIRSGAVSPDQADADTLESIVGRHNMDRNLKFLGRPPMAKSSDLVARVQSVAALRLFQERTAAMESLGALLWALSFGPDGGIAIAHYEHKPRHVADVFRRLLENPIEEPGQVLGWPTLDQIRTVVAPEDFVRFERLRPWMGARLREVAAAYLRPQGVRAMRLGEIPDGYDPRSSVFVVLWHESRRRIGPEVADSVIVKAYNMVKHGFNATALFAAYASAAASGDTAIVIEIPKSWELVNRFGQEIDLCCVLYREFARMSLELDDVGLHVSRQSPNGRRRRRKCRGDDGEDGA